MPQLSRFLASKSKLLLYIERKSVFVSSKLTVRAKRILVEWNELNPEMQ